MSCPICSKDLSPLDLQSRTEHVEICIEYGPDAQIERNDFGQVVITKPQIPDAKRRKICPVCDKTFQNLDTHFKTCAIKNDVPIYLIIEYWDKINKEQKKEKKLPEDLLKNFVIKCIQEERVGEQVELAKTMFFSLTGTHMDTEALIAPVFQQAKGPTKLKRNQTSKQVQREILIQEHQDEAQSSGATSTNLSDVPVSQLVTLLPSLDQNLKPQSKSFPLEYTSEFVKLSNIRLRIERELAASRNFQYSFNPDTDTDSKPEH